MTHFWLEVNVLKSAVILIASSVNCPSRAVGTVDFIVEPSLVLQTSMGQVNHMNEHYFTVRW